MDGQDGEAEGEEMGGDETGVDSDGPGEEVGVRRARGRQPRLPAIRPLPKGMAARRTTPRDNPGAAGEDVDLSFG